MADGTIVVFGADIVKDPNVGANSSGGTQGQGTATLQGGTRVFEDDDIVVLNVQAITGQNELNNGSKLADITVYDSYDDYIAGIVKYDYKPQNPGQTASLQTDVSGHGDPYARFNSTDIFKPDNSPGAPTFNQLFIAPGTNIASVVGDDGGRVTFDRNQDLDLNNDGDTNDPVEPGNNRFFAGDYVTPVICFTAGTGILTPGGERLIETLRVGDLVWTMDSGPQRIRWIGRRRLPATGAFAPVRIAVGRHGTHRALEVSQNHRTLRSGPSVELLFGTSEVLVPAKFLLGGEGVAIRSGGWVDYMHLLFDRHEVIWANGCPSESLRPAEAGDATGTEADARAEVLAIFPELATGGVMAETARRTLRRFEAVLL